MAEKIDFLLVGGGLASAQAARTLRENGASGRVAIVAAETELPYNRPPLSKEFLQGKEERDHIAVKPREFWDEHNVELRLGRRAVALDRDAKVVRLDDGTELGYGRLLLATGGEPRRLQVPGADLGGIHYLRTLADSQAIRDLASTSRPAVIVGGGFIGAETAASLISLGLAVTLVETMPVVLERQVGRAAGEYLTRYFESKGVRVVTGRTVERFLGDGTLKGVRTKEGDEYPAEFAIVGVGIAPRTELAEGAGLRVENGVVVDEYLRTEDPDVFAAGDIASFPDRRYGHRLRIEHWDHAKASGKAAAMNMLGANQPFEHLHYFFSDDFDLNIEAWGDLYRVDEVIERPAVEGGHPRWFYLHEEFLNGAMVVNALKDERKAIQALLKSRPKVDEGLRAKLRDSKAAWATG